MQTISILGCGWLGEPLALYLLDRGYTVKGSTTTPEKVDALRAAGIEPYLIRLDPHVAVDTLADFLRSDLLFLNIPPGRKDPNVRERFPRQVEVLIPALEEAGTPRVVFAGSTSVYPDLNRVVSEEDVGGEISASGQALLEAERMLRECESFDTTVLRFAGLYGYSRKPGRFLAGKQDLQNGDAPVNLVHRDDAVRAAAEVIMRGGPAGTYNVCADGHPTRKALYEQKAAELGLTLPTFLLEPTTRFKIVSNQRLRQAIGFTFLFPDPLQPTP